MSTVGKDVEQLELSYTYGESSDWYNHFGKLVLSSKAECKSSHHVSVITNLTSIHEDTGSIPDLAQWVKDPMLLWLWY